MNTIQYDGNALKILRKDALQNFQKYGHYFAPNDMSLEIITQEGDQAQIKLGREYRKVQKIKKKFDYLDQEIEEKYNEINDFINFSKYETINESNKTYVAKNLCNAQKRKNTLKAIELKLKLAKYDIINKIDKIRNDAINKDFEIVKNISFLAGNTLIDKSEEIKLYFQGPGSFENAFNSADFASDNEMLSNYGQKMQKFFINIKNEMSHKINSGILSIIDEFQPEIEKLKNIDSTSELNNLDVFEKAKRHLRIIDTDADKNSDIVKNFPNWTLTEPRNDVD